MCSCARACVVACVLEVVGETLYEVLQCICLISRILFCSSFCTSEEKEEDFLLLYCAFQAHVRCKYSFTLHHITIMTMSH